MLDRSEGGLEGLEDFNLLSLSQPLILAILSLNVVNYLGSLHARIQMWGPCCKGTHVLSLCIAFMGMTGMHGQQEGLR